MRAAVVVSGVLGAGCALVFAAAALTASLFPNGTLVSGGWNGNPGFDKRFGGGVVMPAMPVPAPAVKFIGGNGQILVNGDGSTITVAGTPPPDAPATDPPAGLDGGTSAP